MTATDTSASGCALAYSKPCEIEDFRDEDLRAVMCGAFPDELERHGPSFPIGVEYRKWWEIAMTLRALRDHGALHRGAKVLGVGAGKERTIFLLSREVGEVVATDLYLSPGKWSADAAPFMMIAPEELSNLSWDPRRITPRHMDGRVLEFADEQFDAVFSSSAIEHFGTLDDVAAAMFEIGRVLKPGGVATISTELLLMGPPGANGFPGCLLFTAETLQRHVIEASGLTLVGALPTTVSEATLAAPRDLPSVGQQLQETGAFDLPHLVLCQDGQVFGSVHLTLRKTAEYPRSDNAWARPSPALREAVRKARREAAVVLFSALDGWSSNGGSRPTTVEVAAPVPDDTRAELEARVREAFERWDAVRARSALTMPDRGTAWNRAFRFVSRTMRRIRDLGTIRDRERDLFRAVLEHQEATNAAIRRDITLLAAEVDHLRRERGDGSPLGSNGNGGRS